MRTTQGTVPATLTTIFIVRGRIVLNNSRLHQMGLDLAANQFCGYD